MKLDQAEKEGRTITRPVKLTEKIGNKILGRFLEVKTLPKREGDSMGDSRVVVLEFADSNFTVDEDQLDGKNVSVYMPGHLDHLIAQVAGKCDVNECPFILITYVDVSKDVKTDFGVKDVHRFTVKVIPESK